MTEEISQPNNNEKSAEETSDKRISNDDFEHKWGLPTDELYRIALKFYKENESKAFHPSYDDRNHLVAFIYQIKHGRYVNEKAPPLGPLDIVGKDRRNAWMTLGDMTEEDARRGFIQLLDSLCSLFKPYVMAIRYDLEEKERIRREGEENERRKREEQQRAESEAKRKTEEEMRKYDEQKRAIQEALNKQTYQQFKAYAEQQYPNNLEEQGQLISQLQEQHYQQYMQQMVQHQLQRTHLQNNDGSSKMTDSAAEVTGNSKSTASVPVPNQMHQLHHQFSAAGDELVAGQNNHEDRPESATDSESDDGSLTIAGASMWTRKDIESFKESIRTEGSDGIIKVGHGEIVTVRVPTHQDGTCIFWEFATDSYDIGFGLLFEWTKNPGNQVSVHISESEDEDEEDEEGDIEVPGDIEKGGYPASEESLSPSLKRPISSGDQPPVNVIIPIYRRDSHEEVYAGSHVYPGKGVYLLKFDNSYSLWRSKTLYYRVYYTR